MADGVEVSAKDNANRQFLFQVNLLYRSELALKLVAIHNLGDLAENNPDEYYKQTFTLFAGYIKEKTQIASYSSLMLGVKPKLSEDIQSILDVIGERDVNYGENNDFKIDLSNTNLQGADLTNADLSNVNFENADLRKANFHGANLTNANLNGADLRDAKNLTIEQLRQAKSLYETKLDRALKIEVKMLYTHLLKEPV